MTNKIVEQLVEDVRRVADNYLSYVEADLKESQAYLDSSESTERSQLRFQCLHMGLVTLLNSAMYHRMSTEDTSTEDHSPEDRKRSIDLSKEMADLEELGEKVSKAADLTNQQIERAKAGSSALEALMKEFANLAPPGVSVLRAHNGRMVPVQPDAAPGGKPLCEYLDDTYHTSRHVTPRLLSTVFSPTVTSAVASAVAHSCEVDKIAGTDSVIDRLLPELSLAGHVDILSDRLAGESSVLSRFLLGSVTATQLLVNTNRYVLITQRLLKDLGFPKTASKNREKLVKKVLRAIPKYVRDSGMSMHIAHERN